MGIILASLLRLQSINTNVETIRVKDQEMECVTEDNGKRITTVCSPKEK
jgi:hypothetical protein